MSLEILRYPSQTPSIFTKFVFSEYSRNLANDPARIVNTAMLTLPLPYDIVDQYGIRIQTSDLGSEAFIAEQMALNGNSLVNSPIKTVMDLAGSIRNRISDDFNLRSGVTTAAEAAVVSPFSTLLNDNIRNALQSQLGIIRNPQTAALFEGVNLKQFLLQWKLSPRNEQESRTIHTILKKIKERAHPPERFFNYALGYPDLCRVEFHKKDSGKIENMPFIDYSFVQMVQVDYMGSQSPVFFKDGNPGVIQFAMILQEIKIQTRRTVNGVTAPNV